MITLFSVRPKGFNVGNEAIYVGLRHLLRQEFGGLLNLVQVPAADSAEPGALSGLRARTVHEMNLYGHGVVVGGGNLYENGGLAVDADALGALRPPLMLFSLSHGRIYDHRHRLVRRTDELPGRVIAALNERSAVSLARDEATLSHLRSLGLAEAMLGGCPTLLLDQAVEWREGRRDGGTLLSIRNPQLMSVPLGDQARVHREVLHLIEALNADGHGPVRVLCHDTRDLAFACTLGDVEYILPDDVFSYLELLRSARLVVSFRLHAFLPCLSFGTPAVNISYDERSVSMVRTLGLESWDINFVHTPNLVCEVRDRCSRLGALAELREAAQPRWSGLEAVMRGAVSSFASLVHGYVAEGKMG
ncbi:MAG: polysaccharide pyruvyl transferase family protein [Gemmatimonadetes bacterium]|nr:polysaccharide pyruvyl transferase family protein [Gemmatimonadota bacterium]